MAVPPGLIQEVESIVKGAEPVNTRVTKVLRLLESHGALPDPNPEAIPGALPPLQQRRSDGEPF